MQPRCRRRALPLPSLPALCTPTAAATDGKPHTVTTIDPWRPYQLHPDHRVAGQAALDAVYAAREWTILPEQLVGGVEPWRVQEAYLFWTDSADAWEEVTCCFEARITALARHSIQVDGNFEEMVERISQRIREAGEALACECAEALKRIRFR